MIGRLADKLLQRIVPSTRAGACIRDYCWCARGTGVGNCQTLWTDCTGRNCTYLHGSCPVC